MEPAKPEEQQEDADDDLGDADRERRDRGAERDDDRGERNGREGRPHQGRPPASKEADGEHDRDRRAGVAGLLASDTHQFGEADNGD